MAEITNANFISAIPNTSVAACFSSSSTLPNSITPAEVLYNVLKAYRTEQVDYNSGQTAPPYISTVGPQVNDPVIFTDGSGNEYRQISYTVNLRQFIGNEIDPQNGTVVI